MNQGKALIFSAPSGSGKTTIVRYLLNVRDDLAFSVSATTRLPRPGEVNGKDYHFLSVEEFKAKRENEELVEWEEVYPGTYYGTLKSEIERIWSEGRHVLFDVDVHGGARLNRKLAEKALGIFVRVPSLDILKTRLIARGTESEEKLNERVGKAEEELAFEDKFDVTIVNDRLADTLAEAESMIDDFLSA